MISWLEDRYVMISWLEDLNEFSVKILLALLPATSVKTVVTNLIIWRVWIIYDVINCKRCIYLALMIWYILLILTFFPLWIWSCLTIAYFVFSFRSSVVSTDKNETHTESFNRKMTFTTSISRTKYCVNKTDC